MSFHISNLHYPFTSKTLTLGANDTMVFTRAPMRFFNKVARRGSKIKALKTWSHWGQWPKVHYYIHIHKVLNPWISSVWQMCQKEPKLCCLPIRNSKLNISTNEIKATLIKLSDKHKLNLSNIIELQSSILFLQPCNQETIFELNINFKIKNLHERIFEQPNSSDSTNINSNVI